MRLESDCLLLRVARHCRLTNSSLLLRSVPNYAKLSVRASEQPPRVSQISDYRLLVTYYQLFRSFL
jgi:hypothetical protein